MEEERREMPQAGAAQADDNFAAMSTEYARLGAKEHMSRVLSGIADMDGVLGQVKEPSFFRNAFLVMKNRLESDSVPWEHASGIDPSSFPWVKDFYGNPLCPWYYAGMDQDWDSFRSDGPKQPDVETFAFPEISVALGEWAMAHEEFNPAFYQQEANRLWKEKNGDFSHDDIAVIWHAYSARSVAEQAWGRVFSALSDSVVKVMSEEKEACYETVVR